MGHPEHGFSEEDERRMLEEISKYDPIIGSIFDSSFTHGSTGLEQGATIDPDPSTEILEELAVSAMNPNIVGPVILNTREECFRTDPHAKLQAMIDQSVPIIPKK